MAPSLISAVKVLEIYPLIIPNTLTNPVPKILPFKVPCMVALEFSEI